MAFTFTKSAQESSVQKHERAGAASGALLKAALLAVLVLQNTTNVLTIRYSKGVLHETWNPSLVRPPRSCAGLPVVSTDTQTPFGGSARFCVSHVSVRWQVLLCSELLKFLVALGASARPPSICTCPLQLARVTGQGCPPFRLQRTTAARSS